MSLHALTIVIVHFNTSELTKRCILSIYSTLKNTPLADSFEISIVDNKSEINEFRALEEFVNGLSRGNIFLYRNCMNSGFGLGCMLALNNSAGKFIKLFFKTSKFTVAI